MHSFSELIERCASFTLFHLTKTTEMITAELQTSDATRLVKGVQMIRLQKAVMAVGMFSIFEAILQDHLNCENEFIEIARILETSSDKILLQKFSDYKNAINVLKHGKGRSYDYLINRSDKLPFRIKLLGQNLFDEGDVSEVTILVDVDDDFVMGCARVIEEVTKIMQSERPGSIT